MTETNDTIDGLLAEFRGYSAGMPPSYHVTMSWADFRRMLDRLEAAHKRERGDVAKLREALGKLRAELWNNTVIAGKRKFELYEIADAALAAPPRNCDRFGSSTQARAEWYKTEVLPRVEGVVSGVEPPFVDWLFAPATETEGGNNGNE